MAGWAKPYDLLKEEFIQRQDEGCVIPPELRMRFAALDATADGWNRAAIDQIYVELQHIAADSTLAEAEPNDLAAIRTLRPEGPRDLKWQPTQAEAEDRFRAAWTGRSMGCALGKPVEGMGMGRDKAGQLSGRKRIKSYLQERQDWPLDNYFSGKAAADQVILPCPLSHRENIQFMESDDDIHYSIVGLAVVEQHGPEFTWQHVAHFWTNNIPYGAICTAETQAILTYWNHVARMGGSTDATPALTRSHWNPYREWIGAQIRSDGWAWVCAGKPELAAEFAWRDAHWTHERNGIYGEMFMAAMQAAAVVESDWQRLVAIGLSEIPQNCRLAQAVGELQTWISECSDWESCMDKIEARWADMHVVHTINNALICVMAMAYGKMDPHESTCISVMAGLDTDCNGATVGNIAATAVGMAGLRSSLVGPLNDTLCPAVRGFTTITMTQLAQRTWIQWQRVHDWHANRAMGQTATAQGATAP